MKTKLDFLITFVFNTFILECYFKAVFKPPTVQTLMCRMPQKWNEDIVCYNIINQNL